MTSSLYYNKYLPSSMFSASCWPDDPCRPTTRGEWDLRAPPWLWPWTALWKRASATRLNTKPTIPTYSNESGSLTVVSLVVSRWIASTTIAKHSARRNTELTNAPRTSALTQPYVFFGEWIFDIYSKPQNSVKNLWHFYTLFSKSQKDKFWSHK